MNLERIGLPCMSAIVALLLLPCIGAGQDKPAADESALRRELQELNLVVGDDPIQAKIEALTADAARAKKLLAVASKMAKEKADAFNYNAAFVLLSVARHVRDVDSGRVFFEICESTARKLQSENKRASAFDEWTDLLLATRKYKEAQQAAKQFLESRAEDTEEVRVARVLMMFKLIRVTALLGQMDEAEKLLEPLKKLFPDSVLTQETEAWLYQFQGKYDEAAKIYEKLLDKTDNERLQDALHYALSGVYAEAGNVDKAAEHLQILLKKNPDSPRYNNDLGYIWADHDRNLEQAEKMIRKAVDKEPQNGAYLDSLGWVLYKKKQYQDALKYLEKAVSLPDGEHPEIYDHLGDVYLKLGHKEKAIAAWRKAIELCENNFRDRKRKQAIEHKLQQAGAAQAGQQ